MSDESFIHRYNVANFINQKDRIPLCADGRGQFEQQGADEEAHKSLLGTAMIAVFGHGSN